MHTESCAGSRAAQSADVGVAARVPQLTQHIREWSSSVTAGASMWGESARFLPALVPRARLRTCTFALGLAAQARGVPVRIADPRRVASPSPHGSQVRRSL